MEKRRPSSDTVIFSNQPPGHPLEPTWYHSFLGSTCNTTSASPAAAETTRSSEKSCAGTPQCCGGRPASVVQGQRASGSGNNLARVGQWCGEILFWWEAIWLLEAGTQQKQLDGRSRKEDLFKVSLTTKYILDIPLSFWQRSNVLSASHASHHSMPDVFQLYSCILYHYVCFYVYWYLYFIICIYIYTLYIPEIWYSECYRRIKKI